MGIMIQLYILKQSFNLVSHFCSLNKLESGNSCVFFMSIFGLLGVISFGKP